MKTLLTAIAAIIMMPFLVSGDETGFMRKARSIDVRAQEIWSAAQPIYSRCGNRPQTPDDRLAKALVAIELNRASLLERFAEEGVVWLAMSMGLDPPDFSLGPAQIRLSTVRALSGRNFDIHTAVDDVYDACKSLKLATGLIALYSHDCAQEAGEACRLEVARRFNGQVSFKEPNLAYLFVFEAVYALASR